jgi:hypothetical protein
MAEATPGTTADQPLVRTGPASRSEGARVGAAIGLFAVAIGVTTGQAWLAAAVVAGPVSGAWAASRIVRGKQVARRVVVGAAGLATLVGAGTVALGLAILSVRHGDPMSQLVGPWLGMWLFGLISGGWIALPALLPIAWLGAVILANRSARGSDGPDRSSATGWLAGLVVGVGAGALSLSIPVIGWQIAVAYAIGGVLSRSTASAMGGFLIGGGASWTALFLAADARCLAETGIGRSCSQPDATPWLAVGFGMLLAGVALSLWAAVTRGPARSDSSSSGR